MFKRFLTTAGLMLVLFIWIPAFAGMTVDAQTPRATRTPISTPTQEASEATASARIEPSATPQPSPRIDITQTTEESIGPFEELLAKQEINSIFPFNFIKYAIHNAVEAGVPPNTIILLLLLPLVIAVIAATRHVIGLRGFGIFLPAALAIVFVAIGPIIGITLFMVIVLISTYARIALRKMKVKLQYLPRMSIILWFVVLGVLGILFLAPIIKHPDFTSVSIFPVLILVLLAEDFSKVQLGKSPRTAIALSSETIVMALVSYVFLTFEVLQRFALLYPEVLLISIMAVNILLGKYVGLRFVEYWRFRKLILKEK